MMERSGEVVITMLPNVQQKTIAPLIKRTIAKGTVVYTDEYDIYDRLTEWGYPHHTVCHSAGEFARDEDGDGFCEVHVNTIEGFWSLLKVLASTAQGGFSREIASLTWGSLSSFTMFENGAKRCWVR